MSDELRKAAQTLRDMLACCEAWEPSVCILGNVRAGDAAKALRAALSAPDGRPCTCHPDDNPPVPCAKKYALTECKKAAEPTQDQTMIEWAVSRWNAEVLHRPMQNIHRRTLDNTWRQVIHRAGGDPDQLLPMPKHDDILAEGRASKEQS